MKATEVFNSLMQSILATGRAVLPDEPEELIQEILDIAKRQDVILLLCCGIQNTGGQLRPVLQQELIRGMYHHTQNDYMLKRTKEILSAEQIRHMPLKGVVIQEVYPKPWTRRSCDIDILIQEKDVDKAVQALLKAGFKTDEKREYHDVSLYYGETHLELHFNICENIPRIDSLLSEVWKYAEPKTEYEYCETKEFFAFHLIAHLLYHFLRGGCNIKQFIDLWILRHNRMYDEQKLRPLLLSCKLEKFYKVICDVSDIWFEGKEQSELSMAIETQVLNGGIEGRKHSDNINIIVNGGIKNYILKSVFLPKREMEWIYPSIKKYPILLPFYYCKRIIYKTIGKDKNRARDILKADKKPLSEADILLHRMGLS